MRRRDRALRGDVREPNAEVSALFATVGGQLASYLARRRVRARARRSFDAAGALVVALDAEGRVEIANGTACAALGYAEDDLLGRDWFATAVAEPEREAARAAFARLLAGEGRRAAATPRRALALVAVARRRRRPLGVLGWGEPRRARLVAPDRSEPHYPGTMRRLVLPLLAAHCRRLRLGRAHPRRGRQREARHSWS